MSVAQGASFGTMNFSRDVQADALARVAFVAKLLDNAFVVPGLNRRIGLDSVIGLVPGIGDAVSAALAGYIVWEARRLGLPSWKIARMIGNIAVDTAIGAIPFAGDLFDVFYKSNVRNVQIIHEHLGMPRRGPRDIDGTVLGRGE